MLPVELQDAMDITEPVGTIKRVCHKERPDGSPCSEGKDACLVVQRVHDGWVYKCHRCNMRGKARPDTPSPTEMLRLISTDTYSYHDMPHTDVSYLPPADAVPIYQFQCLHYSVPMKVMKWFDRYRINKTNIDEYNVTYSPKHDRIIFPIRSNGFLHSDHTYSVALGWVGRGEPFEEGGPEIKMRPKWLVKRKPDVENFYYYIKSKLNDNTFILVEDVVSAIRVHEATGHNAIALLGKWLPDSLLMKLKECKLFIWLDKDALQTSISYWKKCLSLGVEARYIFSPFDPKCYTDLGIQGMVKTL